MQEIRIRIEGVTPLLCNKFTDAAQIKASEGTALATSGDRGTPQEIAESKLYLNLDKKPCIPQPNLLRCIIDAGKFFKSGKSKVTTQKSSLIPACVDIDGVDIQLEHEDPWNVDTRPVRIPSTGGRILAHRPMFNDWALSFTLRLDTTMIGIKLLRDIIDRAGSSIGLGDFRPDCKGPFGKFSVVLWEKVEVAKAAE